MYPEENDSALNYDQGTTGSTKTIGQKLQEARIAHNKTVEEVASQLRLAEKFIIDLENDNYARFASPVYAKGFLRSYVKLLKLPESEILKQFSGADLGGIASSHQPTLIGAHQPFLTKRHLQWILFSAASIMLFGYIFLRNSSGTDTVNNNMVNSDEIKPTIPIEVTNLQDEVKNEADQANQEPLKTEEVNSQQNVATPQAAPQSAPQAAPQNESISQIPAPTQNNNSVDMKSVNDNNFDPEQKMKPVNKGPNTNDYRR